MGEPLVLRSTADGVATITLNRPEVMNALNDPLQEALGAAVREVAEEEGVRCVILTGAGRGFCAGGDLNNRPPPRPPGAEKPSFEDRKRRLSGLMQTARLLHEMPKPTIAMINGACAGAGIGLAGACDLRFAGRSAIVRSAFVEIGLSGDYGSTWFWPRLIGDARAREIMLLSEKLDAEEALRFGLFSRVFDDSSLAAETMSAARRFADTRPWAYRLVKASLNAAFDHGLAEHLDLESENMTWSSRELARAAKAKRDPRTEAEPK